MTLLITFIARTVTNTYELKHGQPKTLKNMMIRETKINNTFSE